MDRFEEGILRILSSAALALTLAALILMLGEALKLPMTAEPLSRAKPGVSSGSTLGLTARIEGGQLFLSWNCQAEPIKTADRAILSITDGGQGEDLELDLNVLRTKRLAYSPLTGDVSFQLQVVNFRRHATASESVRVLAPRPHWLTAATEEHPPSLARSVLP